MPQRRSRFLSMVVCGVMALGVVSGCQPESAGRSDTDADAANERDPGSENVGEAAQALVSYDCTTREDTGYKNGDPFPITVVTVDGYPVEIDTANAFLTLAQAAENDGVELHINSGFRTMAEQEYFYSCYVNCNCNDCNEAAAPGHSNHQSGHALDLNTASGGVYDWLAAHGPSYGWNRTVASEAWHWEWWGGGLASNVYCSTSCDRSAAGLTFSCDGPNESQTCVSVDEPGDSDSWSDNFFCSDADWGAKWSASGPIDGMDCTNVTENADPNTTAWSDDFLCLPPQTPFRLQWNSAGPIEGMSCLLWNEPADTDSWSDNYLCSAPVSTFTNRPFTFSGNSTVEGKHCISVDEPADPDAWSDNYFCSDDDIGMKWSAAGPISGMDCTRVTEAADQHAADWADDYLCLPPGSPWVFTWSSAGPLDGKSCVRWYEASDLAGSWGDNWLCFANPSTEASSSNSSGAGAGTGAPSGQGGAANSDDTNGSGCSVSDSREGSNGVLAGTFAVVALAIGRASRRRRRTTAR